MVSKMTIYNHVKHGCLKRGVEKQLNICELPVLQTWAAGEKVWSNKVERKQKLLIPWKEEEDRPGGFFNQIIMGKKKYP